MSVKANVACEMMGLLLYVNYMCSSYFRAILWWFFTSIINDFESIKLYEEMGFVGRNQEGVGLVIDIKTFEFMTDNILQKY